MRNEKNPLMEIRFPRISGNRIPGIMPAGFEIIHAHIHDVHHSMLIRCCQHETINTMILMRVTQRSCLPV